MVMADALAFSQYNHIFTDTGGASVTFVPQDGSGQQTIRAIIVPPAVHEDVMGGAGTAALRLWVDFASITPQPREGDLMIVGPATYVVAVVEAEPVSTGGAVLKLRTTCL
jgi:hypothetical protein